MEYHHATLGNICAMITIVIIVSVVGTSARLRLPYTDVKEPCMSMEGCLKCEIVELRDTFYELDALGDCSDGCVSERWRKFGYGECEETGEWTWCGIYRNLKCNCTKTINITECAQCEPGYTRTDDGWCLQKGTAQLTPQISFTLPFVGAGSSCNHIHGCRKCERVELNGTFWEGDSLGKCGLGCKSSMWATYGYGECEDLPASQWCAYYRSSECSCKKSINAGTCGECDTGYALRDGVCVYTDGTMARDGVHRKCDAIPLIPSVNDTCNGLESLCKLRADQVAWAGTHNAGAHDLTYRGVSSFFGTVVGDPDQILPWCRGIPSMLSSIVTMFLRKRAESQAFGVARQLSDGIRFLDLDVCGGYGDSTLYTCHCLYGRRISDILADISAFLYENRREVVIVRFDNGIRGIKRQRRLADLVEHHLSAHLAPASDARIKTLGELIACRQTALILWNGDRELDRWWAIPAANFTTGKYTQFGDVLVDQLEKIDWQETGKLHIVSWFKVTDGVSTVSDLAKVQNALLTPTLRNSTALRDRANVILVDHYEHSPVLAVIREMNKMRAT